MSENTLKFIETAEPLHDFAKKEIAPIVDGGWSFFGGFVELFESDRKLGDRMTKETVLTLQLAEKLQEKFSPVEIYSYKLYLELLLREQKSYSDRLGWWTAYAIAPFLVGFAVFADQRGAIVLAALLTVIPAMLFFSYRIGKVNNFTRTLKLACDFVEINEKHRGK